MSYKGRHWEYNKYGAKSAECQCGHRHDSKKEAGRCDELNLLLKAGRIRDLEIQKKYLIIPALTKTVQSGGFYKRGSLKGQPKTKRVTEEKPVYYIADFVYFDCDGNRNVIEDCKGLRTKEYIIKRKLMKQKYCSEDDTVFIET